VTNRFFKFDFKFRSLESKSR